MCAVELRKLGRFEILGEVGSGGMGVVYKGRDPKINRMVALKVIRTFFGASRKKDEIQSLERFYLEAQAAGSLSHQNIVTIYDVGEDDGPDGNIVYIAMEFLDGKGLDHYIDNDGFPTLREKIHIVKQISEGLDYAHKREIIHRDVKPGNIIITGSSLPKLTDFGLARFSDASMTMSGTILGTPNYMSPEQVQGKKVDARSDFFALTVIFYEMLTGVKPFAGETITTVIYKVVNEEPEPPSRIDPSLPKTVDQFIKKGLAKNPADRFQNGIEYMEALDQLLTGSFTLATGAPFDPDATLIVKRSELSYKLESVISRHKNKIIAGGAAAAALFLLLSLYMVTGSGKRPKTEVAKVDPAVISVGNTGQTQKPSLAGKPETALAVSKPTEPGKPAAATKPAEPAKPVTTTKPAGPAKPVTVTKPSGPAKPAAATQPAGPDKPAAAIEYQYITVTTDPAESEVFIGSKLLGATPLNKFKYKSGTYQMVIKHKGYENIQRQIVLDKDLVLDNVKLVKIESKGDPGAGAATDAASTFPGQGSLKISVPKGSGSLIYVDGKEYREENLTLNDLSPGSHIVYIQVPGRNPFTNRIQIEAGKALKIDCTGSECK
jgi:serine/threonine protein kinase